MSSPAEPGPEVAEAFLPPLSARLFQQIGRLLSPLILRLGWGMESVEIPEDALGRLRRLAGSRAIFVANHPTLAEPVVVFHALGRAGVGVFMLTARDTMVRYGRIVARLFQWLGAYSIRRGRRDRAAMEATESLLARGERVLIFPEGQTYGLNDTLLPFQQGVLLMGFHAAEALHEADPKAALPVVPIAIKYVYTRPMLGEIEASLGRLESHLGLERRLGHYYPRLLRIAEAVLTGMEAEQELPVGGPGELKARIDRLRERIVERLSEALGVRVPARADVPTLVQTLANAWEDYLEREAEAGRPSTRRQPAAAWYLYRYWLHLKHFLAIREDYVSEWPSVERFLDVLGRLETDLLGKSRIRGPRRAVVRAGEAVDLVAHVEAYSAGRRETLAALSERLEASVRAMLRELQEQTPPVEQLAPSADGG